MEWVKGEEPIIETFKFGFSVSIIKDTDKTFTVSILEPDKRVRMEKGFKYYASAKDYAEEWINSTLARHVEEI